MALHSGHNTGPAPHRMSINGAVLDLAPHEFDSIGGQLHSEKDRNKKSIKTVLSVTEKIR
jgi:hypothetical protein